MAAPKVLITDYDFPDVELELGIYRAAGVEVKTAQCRTEDDVIREAAGCGGVLVQYAPITSRVLAARPEIRVASRYGAGFDTINTEDARKHGVWVANSPDYGVGEVATHALGMALALVRHLPFYDRDIRAGTWHYLSPGKVKRAGERMAHLSRNAFARVVACDPYIIDGDFPAYVGRVDLEGLFREADVISLHTPLNDETRGMVNARLLGTMKRGSVLVNTARGAIVNVEDLLAALDSGVLDAAGLDVLPVEPPPAGHALLAHPRVLLTPHSAFFSVEAERELRRKAAENIVDYFRAGRPKYVVVEGRN
jgi:D-3-phosphoglycerate dehydrogenase